MMEIKQAHRKLGSNSGCIDTEEKEEILNIKNLREHYKQKPSRCDNVQCSLHGILVRYWGIGAAVIGCRINGPGL